MVGLGTCFTMAKEEDLETQSRPWKSCFPLNDVDLQFGCQFLNSRNEEDKYFEILSKVTGFYLYLPVVYS